MSKDKKVEQEGAQHVIRVGTRTYRVISQIVAEEIDDDKQESSEVVQGSDGSFQMLLSEQDATSIDKSE